ncbi:MAG: 1-acyl-sn-glycerol-3-phosphate acyltransferase [Gammaproteobacteria bacterium]|nr:1-acyl-sn-glycerol-3-phosphate acyltransferase [Gammaproteobacteria bacterium]
MKETSENHGVSDADTPWPEPGGNDLIFLLDARDRYEVKLLGDWIDATRDPAESRTPRLISLPQNSGLHELADVGELDSNSWLQPVRIVWLPPDYGESTGLFRDVFFARTVEPNIFRRKRIARHAPERMRFVSGQGATLSDLRERYEDVRGDAGAELGLADFIRRQALITLERAERVARGARYKVPRLLPKDVFANRDFRQTLANLAQQRDLELDRVVGKAEHYLQEMAARQTPFTLDIAMALYRAAARSNHDPEIDVDAEQLEHIAGLLRTRPVVFLTSHKSMLDTIALSIVLFDANLPLPLTFGGINLNTPGLGALARRAGIIFLRRSFQDNEVYKATFRRYIDYLIDKRFSLLWALEGTRSRTGKLLPPRYGLFNYVVESILRTRLFDVAFVPVSVAYEQITEVEDYAIEQRGQKKKPEGATWIVRFLRPSTPHGKIFLRFGEELSLTDLTPEDELDGGPDMAGKQALVQNLALQVAYRMNAATPITGTAVITLILLAAGTRALTVREIQFLARSGMSLIRRRKLEVVGQTDFKEPEPVKAVLAQLHATGIVSYFDEGRERLYGITEDQHLNAAYYRNTAIHYFVLDALAEIALLRAAEAPVEDREKALFNIAGSLREVFLFEFFFPRRDDYDEAVGAVLEDRFENWREALAEGVDGVRSMLQKGQPLLAHAALRSFADAYRVVARALVEFGEGEVSDRNAFLSDCLKLGRHMRLQGQLFSQESVSKSLYESAVKVAAHRDLLQGGAVSAEGRKALLAELRDVRKAQDTILAITLDAAGV